MWAKTFSKVYPGVAKERVWRLWRDVNGWSAWHGDLEYCRMDGDFAAGNSFRLKPKRAPEVKVVLTEVVEGRRFVDCTSFPGAKMFDAHEMEETPQGLRLTGTVTVTGPLGFFWRRIVAQGVADSTPSELDAVAALAFSARG